MSPFVTEWVEAFADPDLRFWLRGTPDRIVWCRVVSEQLKVRLLGRRLARD
ncbi:hypothetical protein [Streptomyces sp. NPDC005385]|uniref:hypothetical protein n=1 Tax=Streptomyces sp. NPDC005385 TaxID=3157039 RepID=UPI0033B7500C